MKGTLLEILLACSPSPSSLPLTGGELALCQAALPSQSFAKCDMKCESGCGSKRAINTQCKYLNPCAPANIVMHTCGLSWMHGYTCIDRSTTKACSSLSRPSMKSNKVFKSLRLVNLIFRIGTGRRKDIV